MSRLRSRIKAMYGGDGVLWAIVLTLVVFSILVVYSASYYRGAADKMNFRDVLLIVVGVAVMVAVYLVPYKWYYGLTEPIFWISLAVTVFAAIYGYVNHTSGRSLTIGHVTFVPFEVLKVGIVMYLAKRLALNKDKKSLWGWNKYTQSIYIPIGLSVVVLGLVSNSSLLLVCCVVFAMLYLGQEKGLWKLFGVAVLGLGFLGTIFFTTGLGRIDTLISRLDNWVHSIQVFSPHTIESVAVNNGDTTTTRLYYAMWDEVTDSGQPGQISWAKMTIASGGLQGVGAGQGVLRSKLPEAESDFVFAFIVYEYGLLFGVAILLLYTCIFYRAVLIFRQCGNARRAGFIVLGVGTMLTVQAFMHILVSASLFPNTGQQLPMISNGASSMICSLGAVGMMLGISRQMKKSNIIRNS